MNSPLPKRERSLMTDRSPSKLGGSVKPTYGIFPPVGCYQYGDLRDWELKQHTEQKWRRRWDWVRRIFG